MADTTFEMVDIDSLVEADYNPRTIKPQHFAKLKASLRDFGFVDPCIVNKKNRVIVGGHMRRRAAKELGHTEVPVIWVGPLDETEEKALNVALNNAELAGEWDNAKLVQVLDDVKAHSAQMIAASGFEDYQIDRIRRQVDAALGRSDVVYPIASKMLEHYDYVVIWCDNETDFVHLRQILGIVTERSYKKMKKGIGRVMPFAKFIARWEGRDAATAGAAAADEPVVGPTPEQSTDDADGGGSPDVPPSRTPPGSRKGDAVGGSDDGGTPPANPVDRA